MLTELGDVFVNLQLGEEPQRLGNRDRHRAPQGIYLCSDGRWLGLTVNDDDAWRGLTERASDAPTSPRTSGSPTSPAATPRTTSSTTSSARGRQPSPPTTASTRCSRPGVAAAPYADDALLAADAQIAAREWIRPLTSRDVGTFNHLGHAFRGIPMAWERGAPTLGQDNEYVFKEVLGLDDAEYDRLVAERVATNDYYDRDGNPY